MRSVPPVTRSSRLANRRSSAPSFVDVRVAGREHSPRPSEFRLTAQRLRPALAISFASRALCADPLEEPIALRQAEVQRVGERDRQPRAAVLLPAELEHRFAPGLAVYGWEELLGAGPFRCSGRKKPILEVRWRDRTIAGCRKQRRSDDVAQAGLFGAAGS